MEAHGRDAVLNSRGSDYNSYSDRRRDRSRDSRHDRQRSRERQSRDGDRYDRRRSSHRYHDSRRRSRSSSSSDSYSHRRRHRRRSPSTSPSPRARRRSPRPPALEDPFRALRASAAAAAPRDAATAARAMQEQQLRARRAILAQQAAGAAAAAAKSSREVYVGNLVAGAVTEEVLRTLFNSSMRMAFPEAGAADPVVSASVHPDGRYAFVELRTPDMAQAALALNGSVALAGQALSLGRPTGYVDPERALEAARAASAALGRFQARGQAQEEEERAGGDAARPSSGESAFVRLAQSPASVSLDSAQQARWLRDFVSKELEGFGGVLDCMLVSEKEATNPEIGGDDVVAPAEARDTQEEQAALDSGPGAPAAPPADLWVQYMERQEAQRAVEGLRARFPGARLMTAREWLRLSDRRGEAGGC